MQACGEEFWFVFRCKYLHPRTDFVVAGKMEGLDGARAGLIYTVQSSAVLKAPAPRC